MANAKFPFEIKESTKVDRFAKYYKSVLNYLEVGPKKYFLPKGYGKMAEDIYNMPVRPDDVFVVTCPRSGTTWAQELVWLISHDMDFDKAKSVPLTDRYSFLEAATLHTYMTDKMIKELPDEKMRQAWRTLKTPATEVLAETPSPRFIKTHLPISLLPAKILDTAKVVYVARDPRDVVVSYYHFTHSLSYLKYQGDFKAFFDQFISDCVNWSPFLEHVKEGWELRNNPNVLFLFYEDLIKDMTGCLRRVAAFLGKQYSDEQLAGLAKHLHVDNFKNNSSVDPQLFRDAGIFKGDFVRKGKSNGWMQYLDKDMQARMDKWMAEGLKGSTLRFPTK